MQLVRGRERLLAWMRKMIPVHKERGIPKDMVDTAEKKIECWKTTYMLQNYPSMNIYLEVLIIIMELL